MSTCIQQKSVIHTKTDLNPKKRKINLDFNTVMKKYTVT